MIVNKRQNFILVNVTCIMLLMAGSLPVAVCMSKQVRGVARVHVNGHTSMLTFVKRLQGVARAHVNQLFAQCACYCACAETLLVTKDYARTRQVLSIRAQQRAVLRE
ncbi:hypothetical protein IPF37_02120 [bacterium]|nr:MAG: hypothetical protein IPF37_02120 [bacterium]